LLPVKFAFISNKVKPPLIKFKTNTADCILEISYDQVSYLIHLTPVSDIDLRISFKIKIIHGIKKSIKYI